MARKALYWAALTAALLLLSACGLVNDPPSSPTAPFSPPLRANTLTPVSLLTPSATPAHAIFNGPLSVKILEPEDNQVTHRSPAEMKGQADPGTVVTINEEVILVDATGSFTVQIPLNPGDNLVEITASNTDNAQDFAYMNVVYEPQP